MKFQDKVAVITGAGSGIGRSVSLALASLGVDIVAADMDDAAIATVSQEIQSLGRRALAIHCDVSKDKDVETLAAQSISTMGKVDILMNNAGVALRGFVENLSIDQWQWILGINLVGVIRGVHAFLPHMLERGSGYIINTGSGQGLFASEPVHLAPENIAYATSKYAVVGFSEGLFGYLRPKGIIVSVLCPGIVATNLPLHSRYVGKDSKEFQMKNAKENMINPKLKLDVQQSDEVAEKVIKAMKDERFYILTHQEVPDMLMARGQDIQKTEKHLQETFKPKR